MATGEDGGGARPPAGVTFLGIPAVRAQEDQYRLRHLDGTVEGPLATGVLLQRIRDRMLTGNEGVSRDGNFWIPMMAIPQFRDAFDGHGPGDGMTAMGQSLSEDAHGGAAVSAAHARAAAPALPPPLAGMGLGVMGATGMDAFGSGGWPAPDDEGRSLSVPSGGGAGVPFRPASAATGELPSPRGFMGLSGVTEESGALPLLDRGLHAADYGQSPVAPGGSTVLFEDLDDEPELPVSSQIGLPRSSRTLAMSADSGVAGLPGSATGLPASATAFPASAFSAPMSAASAPMSASSFGVGASGFPLSASAPLPGVHSDEESVLPVSKTSARTIGMSAFSLAPGPELPASSRMQGLNLEEIGNAGLWNDDDVIPGARSGQDSRSAAPVGSAARFDFDDDPFADDRAWQHRNDGGTESEASSFFGDEPQPVASPTAAAAPPASTSRARKGSGKVLRYVAAGAVVVALVGAGVLIVPGLLPVEEETVEGTGPVVMAEPAPVVPVAVASVVGELSSLKSAGPAQLREFIASAAVSATSSADDRAKVLIAQCLHQMWVPSDTEAIGGMRSLYDGLVVVEGADAELIALARGAFEAVSRDADPATGLQSVRNPAYVPLARLFEAVYGIQSYRGVSYAVAAPAAPEAAPGFGTGAEGSGAAQGNAAPGEGSSPSAEGSAGEQVDGGPDAAVVTEGSAGDADGSGAAGTDDATAAATAAAAPAELDDAVMRSLERALSADPDLGAALYWSAWARLEMGDYAAALEGFDRLTTANDLHVPGHIGAASALLRSGNLADADARIQRVIDEMEAQSLPSERAQTYISSAEISIARLQTQLAIESLLSALQAEPGNRRALSMLGEQFYESGQYQRALEFFQSHADLAQDDPEAIVGLVRAYLGLQMFPEATSSLEGAVARFPLDGRFPYFLGRVAEEQAEFDRAIEYYTQATQIDGSFRDPWLRLAQLAQRSADVPEALAYLQRVPLAELEDADLANEIGEVYLSLGEANRAVGAFRRALEIDQAYPNARISLAEHYLTIEEYARALGEIRLMVDSGVDTPRVQFLHARALTATGEYSRAQEELTALVNQEADNPEYLHALGLAHFGAGDWVNARRRFTEAYEMLPTMSDALYYMGRCDIELSAYHEAISELSTVSMRSNRGEYHYWLGFALEQSRQQQQAFSEYTKAVVDDIGWSLENPEVFYRRAELFAQSNAPSQARNELQILLTLRPRHAEALRLLGRLNFDERNFDAAIDAWERSLNENSDQPETRYYMGRAWLEREPADLQRATSFLEQARDGGVAETRPDLHRRLGYLYRDLGRTADAVASLRAYLETPDLSVDERRNTQNIMNELSGVR
ncbi:MAG: tetratricopeptide repeat protein [Myxococcales bacterium]|nr:tetratricopeptide repeat protein [Myxococcales bacterium]